jgi:hypothetical protein
MLVVAPQTSILLMLRPLFILPRASTMTANPIVQTGVSACLRLTLRPRVSMQTSLERVYLIKIILVSITCVWVPLHKKGVATHMNRTVCPTMLILQWSKTVIRFMDLPTGRVVESRQSRKFLLINGRPKVMPLSPTPLGTAYRSTYNPSRTIHLLLILLLNNIALLILKHWWTRTSHFLNHTCI